MKNIRFKAATLLILVALVGTAFWLADRPAGSGSKPGSTFTETETGRANEEPTPATNQAVSLAGSASQNQAASADGQRLIDEICGTNAYTRLRELSSSETLSRSECEALYGFLRAKTEDENLARMAAIKNSVMNILRHQPNLPDSWVALLRRILEDEDQHDVIRNYALQHLFASYRESLDEPAGMSLDDAGRDGLRQLFWAMLHERDASFAGTALLGLHRLSSLDPNVDPERLASESLAVLEAADGNPLARISAFQVCALQGDKRALPHAVETAQNGNLVPLRVSAIAALGTLGGAEQIARLKSLLEETNPSVRTAVKEALQRLELRTEG